MNVFATFVRLAFNPVSVEIFEDPVEVFGGLGESVPLFRVVFQQLLVLIFLFFLTVSQVNPISNLLQCFEVFVEIYYQVFVEILTHQVCTCH